MELLFKEVAPVAHLDRAIASGAIGSEFEPRRVHHFLDSKSRFPPSFQLIANIIKNILFQDRITAFFVRPDAGDIYWACLHRCS